MIVVTDIEGQPINSPTRPCGLFTAVSQQPGAMAKFIESWRGLATAVDLIPAFRVSHLGLLSARSMIAVGTELKGMVIAGCIAHIVDERKQLVDRLEAIASLTQLSRP